MIVITIKVQHAIIVFVTIPEQLINLLFWHLLASAADDGSELLPVDVTVTVAEERERETTSVKKQESASDKITRPHT